MWATSAGVFQASPAQACGGCYEHDTIANKPQADPLVQAVAAHPFSCGCAWYIPWCAYE